MSAVTGRPVVVDGIVSDGQLQTSIIKMQRCTLNGCGKVCYHLLNCACVWGGHLLCKYVKQMFPALWDWAFFHSLAYISAESGRIFLTILSWTYPWTRKSPFNLGDNPESESRSGFRPDSPWRRYTVSVCSC